MYRIKFIVFLTISIIKALKKLFIAIALFATATTSLWAQDNENEFQRIATRVLKQYEDPDIMPDTTGKNGIWDGGAYFGASSNGRVMPSGNFRYKKNKLVFTGNVSMEFADRSSDKTDATMNADIHSQITNTDIHRKTEQANASFRLDYYPSLQNCFSFGVLENYNHSKRREEAVTNFFDESGVESGNTIQQQANVSNNQKYGALLQWKHLFSNKASLMARMNLRYLYQKTTVDNEVWKMLDEHSTSAAQEKWNKFTPYGQVTYNSQNWGGFNFAIQEKFTLEDMKVEDLVSVFNYNSATSASTLKLNFKSKIVNLYANGGYEYYSHRIDGVTRSNNDWILKAGATWLISKKFTADISYNRFFKRPTYSQLYDKKHLGSSLGTYYIGNRNLDPALTSQYRLALSIRPSKALDLALAVIYEDIDRDITKISGYDEQEQTSYKTWINDASYENVHLSMDGKWLAGPLDLRWHVKAKHISYTGENVKADNTWSWYFKIRPEVALGSGWKVAGAVYYTGKEVHRTYTDAAYTYVSLRAVKEIGAWAIYGFVQDIFVRSHQETTYSSTNMVLTRTNDNTRAAILGASYTF